jgi:carboxylate-amine ligase
LRVAHWRAARHGLDAELIDVGAVRARLSREVVEALLQVVRPALEAEGEWDEVAALLRRSIPALGMERRSSARPTAVPAAWKTVVDLLVTETAAGTGHTVA